MSAANCLIAGMSHVEAISRGVAASDKPRIINFNSDESVYSRAENTINYDALAPSGIDYLFLSIGGNFYNIFGLIENPVPITFSHIDIEPELATRHSIPYSMMYDYFEQRLDRLTHHIPNLVRHYGKSLHYHISPPPPIQSVSHIQSNPGIFRDRLQQGVTPEKIRLFLYEIQTDIYKKICNSNNITWISPPSEAINDDGFLKDEYRNNDPTHANEQYGSLVWSQIKQTIGLKNETSPPIH